MKTAVIMARAEQLMARTGYPLISIYMPTHRAGAEIWQDRIRFKNLVRYARHDLEMGGNDRSHTDLLLKPLWDRVEDRTFWPYQGEGLAVFRSESGMEDFRLDTAPPELYVVGSQFHLKPLLMSIAGNQTFFVLALSQNGARLFRGTPDGLGEVRGLDLPQGLDHDTPASGSLMSGWPAGPGNGIVHRSEPDHKARIAAYCRRVDEAIGSVVGPDDFMVIAAVDYVAAIFRNVSSRTSLADEIVFGSPDVCGPSELFRKTLPIARAHFELRRAVAEHRFFAGIHSGKAFSDMARTLSAARQGRVDTLFVPIGAQLWGQISGDGQVRISDRRKPQDQDLLNLALIETWKAGGTVYAVPQPQMPGGREVAAVARF